MLTNDLNITSDIANNGVNRRNTINITIESNGELKLLNGPVFNSTIEKYWIPRSKLLEVLLNKVNAVNSKAPVIKLLYGYEFQSIIQNSNGKTFALEASRVENDSQELPSVRTFEADLFIGCDGLNSQVRRWLQKYNNDNPKKFDITSMNSDAAGLQFKILSIQDNFPLPISKQQPIGLNISDYGIMDESGVIRSIPEKAYVIRSSIDNNNPRSSLWMGLLPVKKGS